MARIIWSIAILMTAGAFAAGADQWVVYDGFDGPGKGKHIVLVSGDEEYRSEEALPQLGKILAKHHGFKCTVLFAIDPADGTIKPDKGDNIPGLEALATADLMIIATRFRGLPDEQMKHIAGYLESGGPIIGMRTATHGFRFKEGVASSYTQWSFDNKTWEGGFGKQVLGETWAGHHGHHAYQSTRGVIVDKAKDHPILKGVGDIWGPTDVYVADLKACDTCQPLVMGQVLEGMKPDDKPITGKYVRKQRNRTIEKTPNDPMMPVAWTKSYQTKSGKTSRIFTTTMGASVDLENEGLRRMLVNAIYWGLGMENKIPGSAVVDVVGNYQPTMFGFGKYTPGVKPSAHAMDR